MVVDMDAVVEVVVLEMKAVVELAVAAVARREPWWSTVVARVVAEAVEMEAVVVEMEAEVVQMEAEVEVEVVQMKRWWWRWWWRWRQWWR